MRHETDNIVFFNNAARAAGMPPQNFTYYVMNDMGPPYTIINGRKAFDKRSVQKWAKALKKSKAEKKARWQ